MTRLTSALALVLVLTVSSACSDSDEGVEPTVDREIIRQDWMETPDVFARPGGVMQLAEDAFRLGVISVDGDIAELQILHRDEPGLDRVVKVRQGSVFSTLNYEVLIGTLDSDLIVASWREVETP